MCVHTNDDVLILKKYFFGQNIHVRRNSYLIMFFFLKTLSILKNPYYLLTLAKNHTIINPTKTCWCDHLIFDPILQREGRKRSGLPLYHTFISQEPRECGKLSGVQIFLVQVTVEKWPQDHYMYFSWHLLWVHTPSGASGGSMCVLHGMHKNVQQYTVHVFL